MEQENIEEQNTKTIYGYTTQAFLVNHDNSKDYREVEKPDDYNDWVLHSFKQSGSLLICMWCAIVPE